MQKSTQVRHRAVFAATAKNTKQSHFPLESLNYSPHSIGPSNREEIEAKANYCATANRRMLIPKYETKNFYETLN